jgi:uncharacterized Zn finger protein
MDFAFDGSQDYFEPDVADYAEALGAPGLVLLRERLDEHEAVLPPQTKEWDSTRSQIAEYRERAAVAGGDPGEVIAVFGELTRSYRMHDLAKALAEVGAIDQAITYAERATLLEDGWQAERAGHYGCDLLHEQGQPEAEIAARQLVFARWPTAKNALTLAQTTDHESSSVPWSSLAESVYATLETQHPRELITTLLGRGLPERAWDAAERLTTDVGLWTTLVAAREKSDPAAVVPALIWLIHADLEVSKPQNYKSAVARLKQLRRALTATDAAGQFPLIMAELRDQNRRRPNLIQAFDRAGF